MRVQKKTKTKKNPKKKKKKKQNILKKKKKKNLNWKLQYIKYKIYLTTYIWTEVEINAKITSPLNLFGC